MKTKIPYYGTQEQLDRSIAAFEAIERELLNVGTGITDVMCGCMAIRRTTTAMLSFLRNLEVQPPWEWDEPAQRVGLGEAGEE